MRSRTAFLSAVASIALSVAIAGPAVADPPTYSGPITCTQAGAPWDMGVYEQISKKEIAQFKRYWTSRNVAFCDKASVDTSGLVKDT